MAKNEKNVEEVIRDVVWGPYTCTMKVDSDAVEKLNTQNQKLYLTCKRLVPGGAVNIYLYGYVNKEDVLGKTIAVQAQLRTKNRGEGGTFIHYLRCNVADVSKTGKPTCRLFIGDDRNKDVVPIQNMPREAFREDGRRFMIAFLPLKSA
jgi:hypothetical protein